MVYELDELVNIYVVVSESGHRTREGRYVIGERMCVCEV